MQSVRSRRLRRSEGRLQNKSLIGQETKIVASVSFEITYNPKNAALIYSGLAIIVMGVSGSGKTTLACQLARALDGKVFDADDFHEPASVEKMRSGVALTDEDRLPWLARLNWLLQNHLDESSLSGWSDPVRPIILACSALKESYRAEILRGVRDARLIFLDGDFQTIAARIRDRSAKTTHYMPEALLQSQFDALERPSSAITIDVNLPPDAQLRCAISSLGISSG